MLSILAILWAIAKVTGTVLGLWFSGRKVYRWIRKKLGKKK